MFAKSHLDPTSLLTFTAFAVALAFCATATVIGAPETAPGDAPQAVSTAPTTLTTKPAPSVHAGKDHPATPVAARQIKPPAHDPKAARILHIDGFGAVTVYAPLGDAKGLALFASGDGGWNLGVWDMAQTAASLGYWVAGFSTPSLLKSLDVGPGACSDAAAALAGLSAQVKAALGLAVGIRPVLIGYSSGATIAYAALAQAGDARFSGAMTLGFCPDLIYHKPFCTNTGLTADKQQKPPFGFIFNTVPSVPALWIVLQGDIDKVCSPAATVSFVDKVKNGKVISLPHVGHGYGVPRNWMPQYRAGLIELLDTTPPPHVVERHL